ncbi:hypothetical protein GJ744_000323 [Endocarpon pusillum]|uniref:Uncharacterized protein n=1 Tax=Endocarpon pusillum TaxID=364733 RepID=A0A8H7EAJ2_9EURO|nr:hypothetical protein GJ744_000323 [Endocarpon pusillum]
MLIWNLNKGFRLTISRRQGYLKSDCCSRIMTLNRGNAIPDKEAPQFRDRAVAVSGVYLGSESEDRTTLS